MTCGGLIIESAFTSTADMASELYPYVPTAMLVRHEFNSLAKMKELKIGNLTAKIPIIQGGMGIGVSMSGLASAVANQGGIGVISAAGVGMFESDFHSSYLQANIRALKNPLNSGFFFYL